MMRVAFFVSYFFSDMLKAKQSRLKGLISHNI
jgi:hypothetical protein